MISDLKMVMSLSLLLCVVVSVYGTYFPPVDNSPPIPPSSVRGLNIPSFYKPVDVAPNPPQPREEGFFPPDEKLDDGRWYYEENKSTDIRGSQSSSEAFARYYESDEPAIGPVATPIPDEAYLAHSSSITKLNPSDNRNPDIFILAEDNGPQQSQERWFRIPRERLIEAVNQDSGVPVATDTVKSIVAPVSYNIARKSQPPPITAVNIAPIRPPNVVELQKIYTNFPKVVENTPIIREVVDIPSPANVKNIVQQQIIQDFPPVLPPTAPGQISSKGSFVAPPPPPPPLKGVNSPKVISSVPVNVFPDSNVIISSKNTIPDSNIVPGKSIVQQVRHIWIPTSSNTGKFITIPISGSINSEKSNVNRRFSIDSTPITVSDTWVLKQDGPVPSFQQQKSALSPINAPIVQSGKVIFQNPTIVQVDGPPNPVIAKVDSPKYLPSVDKNVAANSPIDIWPVRNEIANSKVLNSYSPIITSNVPHTAVKSSTYITGKSASELLPTSQKTIFTDTKSALPSTISSSNLQVVNGKPCPLPLPASQKSFIPPLNSGIISVPRIISRQRSLPFARIIRVNRYPTGSYYLINKNVRPSYFAYPNQAIIQQPNAGLINVIQTKQLPEQRNIPSLPVQTKQISIPFQTKQIVSSLPAKQITYPFVPRQVFLPAAPPKTSRIIYPAVQAIRYTYPWNDYSSPIFGNGGYIPNFNSFKVRSKGSKSDSSSSESSSENSSSENSSESSKEAKKSAKSKKEKPKKEEKLKSSENSNSGESEKETESENKSESIEAVSEEKSPEKESKESLESSEN